MDIQDQGVAIAEIFGISALVILIVQVWSWITYYKHLSDIKKKRQDLFQETDPLKKQALLSQFSEAKTPLGSRIQLVNESVLHKRSVGIHELSLLTEEEDSRQWHVTLPNTSISLFLVLGLAGTIWLLKELMSSVFENVENGKSIIDANGVLIPQMMAKIINTLYPGFSHVFVVTLAGIICTVVVLIVRNIFVYRKRSEFFQEMDKFTIEFLLPVEEKLADVLAPFIKIMVTLVSTIMESSRKNTEAIEKSSKANAEAIEKSARLNVEIGIANLQTAKTALEAVNNLGQFSAAMNDSSKLMRQASKELATANKLLGVTFSPDGQWAKLQEALSNNQSSLINSIDAVHLNLNALCTDVTGLRDAAETVAAVDYKGLQIDLRNLVSSMKASDIVWDQLRQTQETLLKDLVNSPNSLNNTFIALNQTVASLGPQFFERQTKLTNTLDGFSTSLTTIEENLPALQSGLNKATPHLLQLCTSVNELNKANFQGLHDGINGLDSSLRTASDSYVSLVNTQKTIGNDMNDIHAKLQGSFVSFEASALDLKQQITATRTEMTDNSNLMKGLNSNAAAIARIDFTSFQQKLDALQVVMTTSQLPKAFPALQKQLDDLSVLLRTWINAKDAERTPHGLDEILNKLDILEKSSKRGWFR